MASIVFEKFRDSWVLSSRGRTPSGIRMSVEPVRIVASEDIDQLRNVISELLEEGEAAIPEPDYDDPDFKRTIFAKAFGLSSYQQYLKEARCFYFRSAPSEIALEEWPRSGRGFLADNPAWKKEFPPGDFGGAVKFLIDKVRETNLRSSTRSRRQSGQERDAGKPGKVRREKGQAQPGKGIP